MTKKLLSIFLLTLVVMLGFSQEAAAAAGVVKMTTNAPAGTKLRIQAMPYDFEVNGADKGTFLGEYFSKGPGTEITLSADGLMSIEVYGCQLTSLNVATAPDLSIIRCYNNELTEINVAACPELAVIDCKNNKIASLDLSAVNKLETVNAGQNELTSLTLGNQPFLTELTCSDNKLAQLDLSGCPELMDLYFANCQLSDLDLSKNTKLYWMYAYNNGIAGEKMDKFIANLPDAMNGWIYIVDTRANEESNVCTMDNVRALVQKGWVSMDFLGGEGTETQIGRFYPGCDYVPTVSERKVTMTTTRAIGQTIKLNIASTNNFTISGVAEEGVSGEHTYTLTSSTVVLQGDVTSIECMGNDLTSMVFDDPSALTYLDCKNNQIDRLDLTGATLLRTCYAQNNQLRSLNVSGCTSLLRLDCYNNNLKGSAMTSFVNSLYEASDEPYLFIIDTKSAAEKNVATINQVDIAKAKGWKVFDYADGATFGMGVAYDGSEPAGEELPDEYFTINRAAKGEIMISVVFSDSEYVPQIKGAELLGWNGQSLTARMTDETMYVYGDAVDLKIMFAQVDGVDVTALPGLQELNLALNNIETIDLSGNAKLESFSCECNLLKQLDFSACVALTYVNCYGNRIAGDAMTDMMTSLPIRTRDDYGTIIVYDQSYAEEFNVCLKSDVELARSRYWVPCELDDTEIKAYDGYDATGIDEVSLEQGNVTFDHATGILSSDVPADIVVYSITGKPVLSAYGVTEISTSSLNPGIYLVKAGNTVVKIAK